MTSSYKERKNEVIAVYDEYIRFKQEISDNNKQEVLNKKIEDIKNDKFVLMVVGEAKSGKSTFINAFLGIEILPMEVLQCTSSIIEISCSRDFKLEAIYADGTKHTESSEKGIKGFLFRHAALDDKYRNIPITAINNELLVKLKGKVEERHIKDLISGVKDDNIYNLHEKEYERLIREYINSKKGSWTKIVTKIKISCPFSDELKGFIIIDSPGVNALGKVGDITEEYIENANAVMFIKSLEGQALESTSFKKFFDSKCAGRHKDTLFLILTYAANKSGEEIYKLRQQALAMYQGISDEKIVCIDSKMRLYHNRLKNMHEDEIKPYFDREATEKRTFAPAENCWYRAKEIKTDFIRALEEIANFDEINIILEKFAHKAKYLVLFDLIKLINKGYSTMRANLEELIELDKAHMEDPAKLQYQLDQKIEEIQVLQTKMNEGIDNIIKKYTDGEGGEIKKQAAAAFIRLDKSLNSLDYDIGKLEQISFSEIEKFQNFRESLAQELVKECEMALVELTDNSSLECVFIAPAFTKEDFAKIKVLTKSKSFETKYYEEGLTFKKTKSYPAYSQEKHFGAMKKNILKKVNDEIKPNIMIWVSKL